MSRWDALFKAANHMAACTPEQAQAFKDHQLAEQSGGSLVDTYIDKCWNISNKLAYRDNGSNLLDCPDAAFLAFCYRKVSQSILSLNEWVQDNATSEADQRVYERVKTVMVEDKLGKLFQKIKQLRGPSEDLSNEVIEKLADRYEAKSMATRTVSSNSKSLHNIKSRSEEKE